MWKRSNLIKTRRRLAQGILERLGATASSADQSFRNHTERFKRIEEGLDQVQRLLVDHLHALRLQFSTARELCAGLAACARADAAHAFRNASAQAEHLHTAAQEADTGEAAVSGEAIADDTESSEAGPKETSLTSISPADDAAAAEEDATLDVPGTSFVSLIPAEFLDGEGLPAAVLHPRLKAQGRALERVAAALMAQKRTHEAVGYACVRSAERLLGAASLAPITRLRDALRRLRPIMEKRRRYQTDVDAYNRRFDAAQTALQRAKPKRKAEAEAEVEALHGGAPPVMPDDPAAIAEAVMAVPPGPVGSVVHPYTPQADDELRLEQGQLIAITSRDTDGWWLGRLCAADGAASGPPGRFPFTYLQVPPLPPPGD